jgi:hypothetical protein
MTEQTGDDNRDQADARGRGVVPHEATDKTSEQRRQDEAPLSAGAVRNGGAFNGGESPADAEDDPDESRDPLDARTHFGGDGAQYVAPDEPSLVPHIHGTSEGDDGFDAAANDAPQTEAD